MRKTLSFAIAALVCVAVQAQIVSSRSVSIKKQKEPSETVWFLRAGLNMAGLAGDDAEGLGKRAAYEFTYGFQKPITSFGMYWGMDLGLGSRGYKIDESDYEQKLLTHNVQVSPFNIGWKYGIVENLNFDIHAGAFVLYDYVGKVKETYNGEEESYGLGDTDWKHFDAGLNIGFGLWYDRFNLDFTFQRGFVQAIEDTNVYTSNFMIRLGVAF